MEVQKKTMSPLQSPTDSDSVLNDEDWVNNTSSSLSTTKNTRSDSSTDVDSIATQKFTKPSGEDRTGVAPPPRPPKPAHIAPAP